MAWWDSVQEFWRNLAVYDKIPISKEFYVEKAFLLLNNKNIEREAFETLFDKWVK